jgi:simple sugar transport system ATP-binding protein
VSNFLEMRGIVKTYGAVCANRDIDLILDDGTVLGLLGENGSGKSTLMKVLFGMVRPDSGRIVFQGKTLSAHRPRDAIAAGIGMIHQHFTLVEAMTVVENVMLGWSDAGRLLKPAEIAKRIQVASATYGLSVDPYAVVADLSFGLRQRVEIVKVILRGAKLLILDEPTSNLSPPEVEGLLNVIRKLKAAGHAVIFISHKLNEVLEICDHVMVLRDGSVSGRTSIANATRDGLVRMMVERDLSAPVVRSDRVPGDTVLQVDKLTLRDATGEIRLDDVSFSIREGEILALAGVDGNGQADLLETIAGIRLPTSGSIRLNGTDISKHDVLRRLKAGVAYIPVDRTNTSLIPGMTIVDNLNLRDIDSPAACRGPILDSSAMRERACRQIADFNIRATGPDAPASSLSGGNQQKIVLAREIGRRPKLLLAFQPTWGLDPGATRFVIDQVTALRDAGGAVLYVSSELEEVLTLGDRVAVISKGRLSKSHERNKVEVTRLGLMMSGAVLD